MRRRADWPVAGRRAGPKAVAPSAIQRRLRELVDLRGGRCGGWRGVATRRARVGHAAAAVARGAAAAQPACARAAAATARRAPAAPMALTRIDRVRRTHPAHVALEPRRAPRQARVRRVLGDQQLHRARIVCAVKWLREVCAPCGVAPIARPCVADEHRGAESGALAIARVSRDCQRVRARQQEITRAVHRVGRNRTRSTTRRRGRRGHASPTLEAEFSS